MSTTYAQKQATTQKKDAPTATSVFDSSAQSESLQRKADMANNAAQRAADSRPNNTGMPDNLKSGIESLSGFSMDNVRVHYNSSKPATVQALAYTQGTDIHVAPGQEKHLPHEAWHVAQQMAGRVSPTTNINGMPVNDNDGLEHEADVMGEKAVQLKRTQFDIGNINKQSCQRFTKNKGWGYYINNILNQKLTLYYKTCSIKSSTTLIFEIFDADKKDDHYDLHIHPLIYRGDDPAINIKNIKNPEEYKSLFYLARHEDPKTFDKYYSTLNNIYDINGIIKKIKPKVTGYDNVAKKRKK